MRGDFIGSGWSYPLHVAANGTIAIATGIDKLEQAMQIVLSTYPGERPMRPEFGCRLRDYIFEGATWEAAGEIRAEVVKALAQWEPRVDVEDVAVIPMQEERGLFHLDIRYTVRETNEERNLVFPFYTIPEGEE